MITRITAYVALFVFTVSGLYVMLFGLLALLKAAGVPITYSLEEYASLFACLVLLTMIVGQLSNRESMLYNMIFSRRDKRYHVLLSRLRLLEKELRLEANKRRRPMRTKEMSEATGIDWAADRLAAVLKEQM